MDAQDEIKKKVEDLHDAVKLELIDVDHSISDQLEKHNNIKYTSKKRRRDEDDIEEIKIARRRIDYLHLIAYEIRKVEDMISGRLNTLTFRMELACEHKMVRDPLLFDPCKIPKKCEYCAYERC